MEGLAIVNKPQCKRALEYSPSPPDNEPIKRDAPGISDETYAQRCQKKLEEYRAAKAQDLEGPFDPNTASAPTKCAEGPRAPQEPVLLPVGHSNVSFLGYPGKIRILLNDRLLTRIVGKRRMQRIPRYQVTENHTPLSNDAIAGVLLRCTPSSPTAQSWLSAHRGSKAVEERNKAISKERDKLRRHVLQLRPKSEWTKVSKAKTKEVVEEGYDAKEVMVNSEQVVPGAGEMKDESCAAQTGIQPTEEELRIARMQHLEASFNSDEPVKQIFEVFKTTARLQIVTCDDQEPANISDRFRAEIRQYYRNPDE